MIYIPAQSPPSLFLSLKLIECYQCDDTSNTARQFGNIISLLFVTTITDTTREINIIQEGMRLTLLVFPRKISIITNIFLFSRQLWIIANIPHSPHTPVAMALSIMEVSSCARYSSKTSLFNQVKASIKI